MKSLQEYIFENIISILEGTGGFNKYFESFEEAIKYANEHKFIVNKYNLNNEIIKQLYNFANKLSEDKVPFTIDESHKELKLRRFFQDNPEILKDLGEFNKSKSHFKFNGATTLMKVGDGCFSSRAKSGANTEPQELLFCHMINNSGNIDFSKFLSQYKLDKSFEHSAKMQYKRIKEYINNDDYVAFRPTNAKESKVENIKTINNLLNKIYSNKKVFHGAKTSYITPADIYIIKKDQIAEVEQKLNDILEAFNKANDQTDYDVIFKDCKQKFVTMFKEQMFIPISLKKIVSGDGHTPEELNIDEYNVDVNQSEYLLRLTDAGLVGNFETKDGDNIKFNFRSNQKTIYPLTFEFNKTGDGGAVGKFKTFVESYIELSPIKCNLPSVDDFYKEYKENNKFDLKTFYTQKVKQFKSNTNFRFEDPKYDNNKLSEIESDDKLFYILVVCLLFVEFLFNLYISDKNKKINDFFVFIEDCYMASKKITKYSLPYLLIK